MPSDILIIGNSILVAVMLVLSILIIRHGSVWTLSVGDSEKQERLKWKILKLLVTMAFIGLVAAVFNIGISLLPQSI